MYYYFDIETTGLDPKIHKIITFQYQEPTLISGEASTNLIIEKKWQESSESRLLLHLKKLLIDLPLWKFVPVGNNLLFDLLFISERLRYCFGLDITMELLCRPWLDIKPVLVMINGGRFRNYGKFLEKTALGNSVPMWYKTKEYEKIIRYVEMEAEAFLRAYNFLTHQLPLLADVGF